jgi:hypothetical protein
VSDTIDDADEDAPGSSGAAAAWDATGLTRPGRALPGAPPGAPPPPPATGTAPPSARPQPPAGAAPAAPAQPQRGAPRDGGSSGGGGDSAPVGLSDAAAFLESLFDTSYAAAQPQADISQSYKVRWGASGRLRGPGRDVWHRPRRESPAADQQQQQQQQQQRPRRP